MNLDNFDFDNNYNTFLEYLYKLQDKKYLEFHSKLVSNSNIIGIREQKKKKIAEYLSKNNYNAFIKNNTHCVLFK